MSILHYFSKDANKRAKFIFNLIAPVYSWIDKHQAEKYADAIHIVDREIGIKGKRVLDVGTGTGAWAAMFMQQQATEVCAVDLSVKMLEEGEKKHRGIVFSKGDAENLSGFEDDSFDIVTAAFVLHGVKSDRRRKILSEMKRISQEYVVINDFSGKTGRAVNVLELLERSDFRNFKTNFRNELESIFTVITVIEMGEGNGLYVAAK